MTQARQSARQRTLLVGRVIFNNRWSTLDCTIRDLSAEGARLSFTTPTAVPDSFELDIPAKNQHLRAVVRWRRDRLVGVSFVGAGTAG